MDNNQEDHPHHRKLKAIQEQTAETRDLMILTASYQLGILDGDDYDQAKLIVGQKLRALLRREEE